MGILDDAITQWRASNRRKECPAPMERSSAVCNIRNLGLIFKKKKKKRKWEGKKKKKKKKRIKNKRKKARKNIFYFHQDKKEE
jgi:hypothetical protein